MTQRSRFIVLVFALAGLACAVASSWVHYRVLTDASYVSPCDINATFNCTQVYLSRFGSVLGVPVALGGVFWFSLVALLAAFGGQRGRDGRSPADYLFPLALIGLAVIVYLGTASLVVLHTACVLCLGTYACVLGIMVTTAIGSRRELVAPMARLPRDLASIVRSPFAIGVALVYLSAAVAAVALFPKHAVASGQLTLAPIPADAEQKFAEAWAAQPRVDLHVAAGQAPVVIVKFNDWMCSSCKAAHEAMQPLLEKYAAERPGAVLLIAKDFPLNSGCNEAVSRTKLAHEAACDAAVAVRTAREHGRADAMIDWLFAEQTRLGELSMQGPKAAEEIHAKLADLTGARDFDAEAARWIPAIRGEAREGMALEIHATPTFFINGVRATTGDGQQLPLEYIDLAIRLELKKGG